MDGVSIWVLSVFQLRVKLQLTLSGWREKKGKNLFPLELWMRPCLGFSVTLFLIFSSASLIVTPPSVPGAHRVPVAARAILLLPHRLLDFQHSVAVSPGVSSEHTGDRLGSTDWERVPESKVGSPVSAPLLPQHSQVEGMGYS